MISEYNSNVKRLKDTMRAQNKLRTSGKLYYFYILGEWYYKSHIPTIVDMYAAEKIIKKGMNDVYYWEKNRFRESPESRELNEKELKELLVIALIANERIYE